MLICAGLSEGKSTVHGIAPSEDVLATLDCLEAMGAEYTYEGDTVTINGIGKPHGAKKPLYCRESGSTLRFFLPLCNCSQPQRSFRNGRAFYVPLRNRAAADDLVFFYQRSIR